MERSMSPKGATLHSGSAPAAAAAEASGVGNARGIMAAHLRR
jgi:hypothetical protein